MQLFRIVSFSDPLLSLLLLSYVSATFLNEAVNQFGGEVEGEGALVVAAATDEIDHLSDGRARSVSILSEEAEQERSISRAAERSERERDQDAADAERETHLTPSIVQQLLTERFPRPRIAERSERGTARATALSRAIERDPSLPDILEVSLTRAIVREPNLIRKLDLSEVVFAAIEDRDPELARVISAFVASPRVRGRTLDSEPALALAKALTERDPILARVVEVGKELEHLLPRIAGESLVRALERDPALLRALNRDPVAQSQAAEQITSLKAALVLASTRDPEIARALAVAITERDSTSRVQELAAALAERDAAGPEKALIAALSELDPTLKLAKVQLASRRTITNLSLGVAVRRVEGAALALASERDPAVARKIAAAVEERDPPLAQALERRALLSESIERFTFSTPSETNVVRQDGLAADSNCLICLEKYKDGADIGRLKCGHHADFVCLSRWLSANPSCPMCRVIL